jgi:uncharacterized protein (TIGR02996 family)
MESPVSLVAPELPASLLAAIASDPDGDSPRLVAADWFAEHGDPDRAELISLQCRLNQLPLLSPEAELLEDRVGWCLARAPLGWVPELPGLELSLRRGFAGAVSGEPAQVLAAVRTLCELTPPIRSLMLSSLDDDASITGLMQSPLWPQLRRVSLQGLRDATLQQMVQSGSLSHLVGLYLGHGDPMSAQTMAALARGSELQRLASFSIGLANVSEWALARPDLPALKYLQLGECSLSDEAIRALVTSPSWLGIRELQLHFTYRGAQTNLGLCSQLPPTLEALQLSHTPIDVATLEAIARAPRGLKILRLRSSSLRDAAALPLLQAPWADTIEWLDLRHNWLDAASVRKLRERFGRRLLFESR